MVSQNDGWFTSFVMSTCQDKHFFVIILPGISAILRGAKDVKLGEFFSVKYVLNQSARPSDRAQHIITQYKPIAPLGSVRIDVDERGIRHVLVRTTARFDGLVVSKNKQVARLSNKIFGKFIDVRDLVKERNKLIDFEFKCKASENDKYSSIFTPVKVIGYSDLPMEEDSRFPEHEHNFRNVVGFVCSQIQPGGFYYLWANSLERDAVLEQRFWPEDLNVNICGCWVQTVVNIATNHVVEMVTLVEDVYKSRVERGVPEVLADVTYDSFNRVERYDLYTNFDFGLISDPDRVIRDFDMGRRYTVWIVRQKTPIPGCRWKISPFQLEPEDELHHSDVYDVERKPRDSDEFSRAPTTDSEDDSDQETGLPTIPTNGLQKNQTNHSTIDDVAPGRRRQRAPSNGSSHRALDQWFERNEEFNGNGSNHYQQSGNAELYGNREQLSRPTSRGLETPSSFDRVWSNSNYGTPMGSIPQNSSKSCKTLEDEIALKNEKIRKYADLINFFTKNETVLNAMMGCDSKKCQELLKIRFEKNI